MGCQGFEETHGEVMSREGGHNGLREREETYDGRGEGRGNCHTDGKGKWVYQGSKQLMLVSYCQHHYSNIVVIIHHCMLNILLQRARTQYRDQYLSVALDVVYFCLL